MPLGSERVGDHCSITTEITAPQRNTVWKASGGRKGSPVRQCEMRCEAAAGDAVAQRRAEVKAL